MAITSDILRVAPYILTQKLRLARGITAFGIARCFEAMVPFLTGVCINHLSQGNYDITWPCIGIAAAVIARYIVVTYARFSVRSSALMIAFDLRQDLFAALQRQGKLFYSNHSIGDMMTRAISDIALIQRLISMGTVLLVIMVYAALVGFSFMLYYSPILTLLVLPPMPLTFYYAWKSSVSMGTASEQVQDELSHMASHVQENFSGIRTIQAMAQEKNEAKRFNAVNNAYGDAFYNHAKINSLMSVCMPSIAAICTISILGYGGWLVSTGQMPVGHFVAFFMFVNMVSQPFRVAGIMVNLFQRAAVASRRLDEILSMPDEIPRLSNTQKTSSKDPNINISDLTYTYPNNAHPTLKNIELNIAAGTTVAIMGRVGSGKTTLLNTIVRLLDPPDQSIKLAEQCIRQWPLKELRTIVTLVPQDAFLFANKLRENIAYDDATRDDQQINEALMHAALPNVPTRFPKGLDTLIGERGVTLSGGQKQRATVARTLIRDPDILLLDDCFSSVDTETEETILNHILNRKAKRTTILVSNRISTARHADQIIILDNGMITEQGDHATLVNHGGYYAELDNLQRDHVKKSGAEH